MNTPKDYLAEYGAAEANKFPLVQKWVLLRHKKAT
jgi:hypothetical protein